MHRLTDVQEPVHPLYGVLDVKVQAATEYFGRLPKPNEPGWE
jgi:hypothetical protein